jgi:mono/diheme cytochrome c family protein
MKTLYAFALVLFLIAALPPAARAVEPAVTVAIGGTTRTIARSELLARPDVADVTIPNDVAYGRAMTYRSVPLAGLLADFSLPAGEVLEVIATDGFAASLPASLAYRRGEGGAQAYLAIETTERPWPALAGKSVSAGPFYVVWVRPEAGGIRTEQWPYAVAAIKGVPSPTARWPQIGVGAEVSATDPIRTGLETFATQCMACHKMNGAGAATMGPDLNLPRNPTEYFTGEALRQLIRNPASLRSWEGMQMQGFAPDALSDREIDEIVAYLSYMAPRKTRP